MHGGTLNLNASAGSDVGAPAASVPILMYHSVWPGRAPAGSPWIVAADTLRRQLGWLARRGFRSWGADQLVAALRASASRARAPRSVVVTFDDGYADNFDVALPLLLEHDFTATIFAMAPGRQRRNWWDCDSPMFHRRLLSPRQMRAMASAGITFGSHGLSHYPLPLLDDRELTVELTDSKHALEDVLGKPVTSFAYPFGAVNARVKEAVRAAGYTAAFAVHSGPFDVGADLLEMRRVHMGGSASRAYLLWKLHLETPARRLRAA